jgi:hypothetical protein
MSEDRIRDAMRRQQAAVGPAMNRVAEEFVAHIMQGHLDLVAILEHPDLAEMHGPVEDVEEP